MFAFVGGIALGHLFHSSLSSPSPTPNRESTFLSPSGETPSVQEDQNGTEKNAGINSDPFYFVKEILQKAKSASSLADARLSVWEAICRMDTKTLESLFSEEAHYNDTLSTWFEFAAYATRRLGEIAPEKAALLWLKSTAADARPDDRHSLLLEPWIRKDPQGFSQWLGAQSANAQTAAAYSLSRLSLQSKDFAAVLKQLPSLTSTDGHLNEAVDAAMRSSRASALQSTRDGKPEVSEENRAEYVEKVLTYARGLPEGPSRSRALVNLASDTALDFSQYPDIVAAVTALPPADISSLGRSMAPYAEKLPEGLLREAAVRSQFEVEAKADAEAAGRHVNNVANTKDYTSAVLGFVNATAREDPGAALGWALSIPSGGDKRGTALETAAREFFRQKPEEARAWLAQAPLTDAEYFRLTGRSR